MEEHEFEGIYKNNYRLEVFLNYCMFIIYLPVSHADTAPTLFNVMHARLSSSLSSSQAFRVQLSYCRLNLGYISAFLTPDRSTVGETRKYQTRSAFLDSLSSAQR